MDRLSRLRIGSLILVSVSGGGLVLCFFQGLDYLTTQVITLLVKVGLFIFVGWLEGDVLTYEAPRWLLPVFLLSTVALFAGLLWLRWLSGQIRKQRSGAGDW